MTTRIYVQFDNPDDAHNFLYDFVTNDNHDYYGITDSGYLEED